jgi:3',5'-cyclic AMP phosphodiesterase CpdA
LTVRIVHVTDIHFWQYAFNPLRLMSKRMLGTAFLLAGRAKRFHLAGVARLVDRVRQLEPDHILITGDLTTTALPDEFRAARRALADWLDDPARVTIIPGNHDRYTWWSHRSRRFERFFGEFAPRSGFPWLRSLDADTAILGLDATRSGISATGKLPVLQLAEARRVVAEPDRRPSRLIVACHYPVAVPDDFEHELARKRMVNAGEVREWLRTIGPHLFCCGHIHAAWAFRAPVVPNQICINPGPPLLPGHYGHNHPGFVEIRLDGSDVTADHHSWSGESWEVARLHHEAGFFQAGPSG